MTTRLRLVSHPRPRDDSRDRSTARPDPRAQGGVEAFLAERTRLLRIARRVTGDPETAEDVVQEVWVRWQRTDRSEIRNASAFLATATTHAAINVIQSARRRHESVASTPLTDLADATGDPSLRAEREDAVRRAMALMMMRLNPTERAVYVLRKGFDYPYQQVADVLDLKVANARQLVLRAQHKLVHGRVRPYSRGAHRRLVDAFLSAASTGELASLELLLAAGAREGRRPTTGSHERGPLPDRTRHAAPLRPVTTGDGT